MLETCAPRPSLGSSVDRKRAGEGVGESLERAMPNDDGRLRTQYLTPHPWSPCTHCTEANSNSSGCVGRLGCLSLHKGRRAHSNGGKSPGPCEEFPTPQNTSQ